jgi:antitoxin ParD1/3/4
VADESELTEQQKAKLAALDAALARGLSDAEAGRVKSVDDVFDRLETKYREKAAR